MSSFFVVAHGTFTGGKGWGKVNLAGIVFQLTTTILQKSISFNKYDLEISTLLYQV